MRRFFVSGVIFRITENAQRDQTIEHRRKDCGQTVAALADSLQHPALRFFERAFARWTDPQWVQDFQNIVEAKEKIAPGPKAFASWQPQIALFGTERIKLVQLLVARQRARRFEMVYDGEGNQHRPAPRRHFVDREWGPARQQNHFYRNGRQIFPRKLPEEREIKFAERVHPGNAAETQNILARFAHERQVRRITGQFQREVAFDRCIDLARAAKINIPTPVRQLPFQNVTGAAFLKRNVDLTEPVHEKDEVGAKCAVDQQLAAPMPVRTLLSQQVLLRTRNRVGNFGISRQIRLGPLRRRAWQCHDVS